MHEGLPWNWETFPDFLNVLEKTPAAVDFGAMIGHAPVRTYVMGLRGAEHRPGADKVNEREASQEVADPIDSRDLELMQEFQELPDKERREWEAKANEAQQQYLQECTERAAAAAAAAEAADGDDAGEEGEEEGEEEEGGEEAEERTGAARTSE